MIATLALAVAAMLAVPVQAQTPGGPSGTIHEVDDSLFPEVRVIVTLAGQGGRPVNGLTSSSFSAVESGQAATVSRVNSVLDQQIGIDVVLAIDTSSSMFGTPMLQAKQAAVLFVQGLQPSDRAAVVSFSTTVTVASGFSAEPEPVVTALNALQANGDTALYQGLIESFELARSGNSPRKAVILLSDGVNFGAAGSPEEAIAAAVNSGIPVYVIGLGSAIDRPFLENIARLSGGAFLEAPDSSAISELYEQLAELLKSQYVLTLNSTAAPEITDRSVRLVVNTPDGPINLTHDYKTRRLTQALSPTAAPGPAVIQPSAPRDYSLIIVGVLAPIVLGGLAYVFVTVRSGNRARRLESQIGAMSARASEEIRARPIVSGAVATIEEPGIYVLITGPGVQQRLRVDAEPLAIGTGESNQLRLQESSELGKEHARVWNADGRLVFHQLDKQRTSRVNGSPVTWVSLKPGDVVEMGPYTLRVQVD